jgi:hypothetical protein
MTLYFAYILDHKGTEVERLQWTSTTKHSAFLAQQYLDSCPPAAAFKITKRFVDPSHVAKLMNKEGGL